jgi:DNA invertase Pin-like site-specific DNA recombinase
MKESTQKKSSTSTKTKRHRAVITPQLRKEAVSLIKARTVASAVAKRLNISVATVYNIKKAAGLVKARGTKVAKKARKK